MNARALISRLHTQALAYPDAYEELPWGHPAIKVRNKTFMWCGETTVSVKLPESGPAARELAWVEPTHYGMGKHGWVTATVPEDADLDMLLAWVDESFRAVAPKTLVKKLGPGRPVPAAAVAVQIPHGVPRVLVVGNGPKRAERCEQALAEADIPVAVVDLDGALDAAGSLQPEVIVVDLGREPGRAEELATQLKVICPLAHLVLAGVRETPGLAADAVHRAPPGDPAVVAGVRELLP